MNSVALGMAWDNAGETHCLEFAMAHSHGFGSPRTVKHKLGELKQRVEGQGTSTLDLETRTRMWQAGLLQLRLPEGVEVRLAQSATPQEPLTGDEIEWLNRAAKAEYIASEDKWASGSLFTPPHRLIFALKRQIGIFVLMTDGIAIPSCCKRWLSNFRQRSFSFLRRGNRLPFIPIAPPITQTNRKW